MTTGDDVRRLEHLLKEARQVAGVEAERSRELEGIVESLVETQGRLVLDVARYSGKPVESVCNDYGLEVPA